MLVLTRKRMEKLYIGGDICVTVVRLEGGQVRLGIDAPRHVPVVRAELRQRDEAEAAAAATLSRLGVDRVGVETEPTGSVPGRWPVRPIPVPAVAPTSLSVSMPLAGTGRNGPGDQSCATNSGSRKR